MSIIGRMAKWKFHYSNCPIPVIYWVRGGEGLVYDVLDDSWYVLKFEVDGIKIYFSFIRNWCRVSVCRFGHLHCSDEKYLNERWLLKFYALILIKLQLNGFYSIMFHITILATYLMFFGAYTIGGPEWIIFKKFTSPSGVSYPKVSYCHTSIWIMCNMRVMSTLLLKEFAGEYPISRLGIL